jgi:hypothetical protein
MAPISHLAMRTSSGFLTDQKECMLLRRLELADSQLCETVCPSLYTNRNRDVYNCDSCMICSCAVLAVKITLSGGVLCPWRQAPLTVNNILVARIFLTKVNVSDISDSKAEVEKMNIMNH